jgi:hypothetical protein
MSSLGPVSALPVSAAQAVTTISTPILFRFSDRGYTTEPDDPDLPNIHFEPRVRVPLTLQRSLPLSPGSSSRVLLQVGETSLINADGGLNKWIRDYRVDGRPITIKVGKPGMRYAEFSTLLDGIIRSRKDASRAGISFDVRDSGWELLKPAQRNLFKGTGGREGTADLKGKPKPKAYGACNEVLLVCIDPVLLIYQWNDGRGRSVRAVYDSGVALTAAGDVADIGLATPDAGSFVTELRSGLLRLGAAPVGLLTADVLGDMTGGSYVDKAADIAYRVMTDLGEIPSSQLNSTAFARLRGQAPAPIGVYTHLEPVTVAGLQDTIFAGVGAWWGEDVLGAVECGLIQAPLEDWESLFDTRNVFDYQSIPLPDDIDPPLYRAVVGWGRNWTVQLSGTAPGLPAERQLYLSQQYRTAAWERADVHARHLGAQVGAMVPGLYARESDAQRKAEELGALWGTRRNALRFTTKVQGFRLRLGSTQRLDLPIEPLAGGTNVVVIGTAIDTVNNRAAVDVMW